MVPEGIAPIVPEHIVYFCRIVSSRKGDDEHMLTISRQSGSSQGVEHGAFHGASIEMNWLVNQWNNIHIRYKSVKENNMFSWPLGFSK